MAIKYRASLTCLAVFLTSAVLVPAAAMAGTKPETLVVTAPRDADQFTAYASYRDLNLVLASDQRRLNRRVKLAVEDVCALEDHNVVRTMGSFVHYQTCRDGAWTGARPQMVAAIEKAKAGFGAGGNEVASIAITVSARAGE